MNYDQGPIFTSKSGPFNHFEPIASLHWLKGSNDKTPYNITTIGNDGKILTWDVEASVDGHLKQDIGNIKKKGINSDNDQFPTKG